MTRRGSDPRAVALSSAGRFAFITTRTGGSARLPARPPRQPAILPRATTLQRTAMTRKSTTAQAGQSQRQLRVGELVRHTLAELLQRGDVHDPVIADHVITVTEVRMSPDLKLATAYVMPLSGADAKEVVKALERNKKYLRGFVARRVNMKFAPDIRFRYDESFGEAERIERLLRSPQVTRDTQRAPELAPDENEDDTP
jgi:ribosome-binding factor A